MKTVIHLDGRPVQLETRNFQEEVDVDQLLSIDHSNLYGEAVTISALLNHTGILKAEAERALSEKKLELEVFESTLRQSIRKDAVAKADKLTEAGLNELVSMDGGYQIKKKNVATSQYNLGIVDSIFWAVQSKDRKLNNLIKGVTPQELFDELVEGVVNNIVIKKRKSIVE
jgi:hypothetical protein